MNDETARLNLSASAYRVYQHWRRKKCNAQRAYDLAILSFNDNREYQREKRAAKWRNE